MELDKILRNVRQFLSRPAGTVVKAHSPSGRVLWGTWVPVPPWTKSWRVRSQAPEVNTFTVSHLDALWWLRTHSPLAA